MCEDVGRHAAEMPGKRVEDRNMGEFIFANSNYVENSTDLLNKIAYNQTEKTRRRCYEKKNH